MRGNMIETLIGAIVLAAAAMFLVFAYGAADLPGGVGYDLTAKFNKIGSVKVGSDVRVSGITVGTVTNLELDPETFKAEVTITIGDEFLFSDDTTAAIASEGLLGGNFVELVPGGSPNLLVAGDYIEFTQDSVDIVQLLGRFIFSAEKAGAVSSPNQ